MRILITFTPDQLKTLNTLMAEDNANNRTAYIQHLIGQEARRRRELRESVFVGGTDYIPKEYPTLNAKMTSAESH